MGGGGTDLIDLFVVFGAGIVVWNCWGWGVWSWLGGWWEVLERGLWSCLVTVNSGVGTVGWLVTLVLGWGFFFFFGGGWAWFVWLATVVFRAGIAFLIFGEWGLWSFFEGRVGLMYDLTMALRVGTAVLTGYSSIGGGMYCPNWLGTVVLIGYIWVGWLGSWLVVLDLRVGPVVLIVLNQCFDWMQWHWY